MDGTTAKGPGSQMLAPAIQIRIDQKLYHLTRPTYSEVLASAEKLRDAEARVQKPANANVRGLRSEGLRL